MSDNDWDDGYYGSDATGVPAMDDPGYQSPRRKNTSFNWLGDGPDDRRDAEKRGRPR